MESSFFIKSGKTGLVFLLCLCLAACTFRSPFSGNRSFSEELQSAESFMYTRPDSALRLLERMPSPSGKCQHATWALLLTQARYRCYVEQSDSLLDIASGYFMEGDNSQRKALTLYCRAGLCEDIEERQGYLLMACAEVDKTTDCHLGYLCYAKLTNLYAYRGLYEYALRTIEKARSYAEETKRPDFIISSYLYLGRIYGSKGQDERSSKLLFKAVECYKYANEGAEASQDSYRLAVGMNELAALYLNMGEYEQALHWIQKTISLCKDKKEDEKLLEKALLILANVYKQLHQYEEARQYLEKLLSSNDIYTLRSAYQALSRLNDEQKNYKEAVLCLGKLWMCQDSIQELEKKRALIEMQEKYDKQQVINEKELLRLEKDAVIKNLMCIVALSVLLAIGLICIYQRKLLKRERIILSKERQIEFINQKMKENEQTIEQNRRYIEELVAVIKESKCGQEQLSEQVKRLQEQSRQLMEENLRLQQQDPVCLEKRYADEIARLRSRDKFLCDSLVQHIDVLNSLKENPKRLTPAQMEKVREQVDCLYERYTERLRRLIPSLTEGDIRLCVLIKLHIPNQDIATILCISPASVSTRKFRLKERILHECDWKPGRTLDSWLQEL